MNFAKGQCFELTFLDNSYYEEFKFIGTNGIIVEGVATNIANAFGPRRVFVPISSIKVMLPLEDQ